MRSRDEILAAVGVSLVCPYCEGTGRTTSGCTACAHYGPGNHTCPVRSCAMCHATGQRDLMPLEGDYVQQVRTLDALRAPTHETMMAMRAVYASGVTRLADPMTPSTAERLTKMLAAAVAQAEREATA